MKTNKLKNQISYYQRKANFELNQSKESKANFNVEEKHEDNRIADPSVWEDLSQEYDITNATYDELQNISKKLYDAKQISLLEHGILTFNPTKSPQWDTITKGFSNPKWFLTDANSSGKRNWIEEYGARIKRDKKIGNFVGLKHKQKVLKVLKRLA